MKKLVVIIFVIIGAVGWWRPKSVGAVGLLQGTVYSVNLPLTFGQEGIAVQTIGHFKQSIDMLTTDSAKVKLIRSATYPWDLVSWANLSGIDWKSANLDTLAEAIR